MATCITEGSRILSPRSIGQRWQQLGGSIESDCKNEKVGRQRPRDKDNSQ
ncbi:MAG: hypothetical protein OEW67_12530 [Cyclobacteriaceae bacterium]|nr:hypothetical protein [Cyclobacteriaceae bacterium]